MKRLGSLCCGQSGRCNQEGRPQSEGHGAGRSFSESQCQGHVHSPLQACPWSLCLAWAQHGVASALPTSVCASHCGQSEPLQTLVRQGDSAPLALAFLCAWNTFPPSIPWPASCCLQKFFLQTTGFQRGPPGLRYVIEAISHHVLPCLIFCLYT